jgi:colanic acid/amylovoran biosynthesis glycosyltransferase
VLGLREAGFEIETWGLRPADPAALRTERNRREAAATRTLRPVAWGATLRAHLRAVVTAPVGYVRTGLRALRDRAPGVRALALSLAAFAGGIRLWDELDRRGIRHLHVHWAGSPTHVAALVTAFGNHARRDDSPWTWSMTVHGPTEFADNTALRYPERIREALFLVATSDFARSQLLRLLPTDEWPKVRVVRCGVDLSGFDSADERPAREDLRILYVGTLLGRKGQPVLLEALAGLRRRGVAAHVTLVGGGPERDALEALARRLGVAEDVTFTGGLGHDDVREQYNRADVFCLPSFAEGQPVVLMEAMAARLPVVSTWIAGTSELVENGAAGFLTHPGRADELEEALARLAADGDLRRRMGEHGRAKVVREHDRSTNARELAELHREFRGEAKVARP